MAQPGLGILERDRGFGAQLSRFCTTHGLPATLHADSTALLADLQLRPPRLVTLAGGGTLGPLPLLHRLRDLSRVPCVILGEEARDSAAAIPLLEAGADDVIDREQSLPAILARFRAILRRAEWGEADPQPAVPIDGWNLIPQRRQLLRPEGDECPLTTAEFDLIRLLVDARGRPVSRDAIAQAVFRRPFRAEDRTVDNLVLRLRRKLGTEPHDPIKTVRGAGYMFAGFAPPTLRVAS